MTDARDIWRRKQDAASPGRYYGYGGTVQRAGRVNVEVDDAGRVVGVWFRCQVLPFTQRVVSERRAAAARRVYDGPVPSLTGVEVLDQ